MKKVIFFSAIALMSCSNESRQHPFEVELFGDVSSRTEYWIDQDIDQGIWDTLKRTTEFFEDGLIIQMSEEYYRGGGLDDPIITNYRHTETPEGYQVYANGELWVTSSLDGNEKKWYLGKEKPQILETKIDENTIVRVSRKPIGDSLQEIDTVKTFDSFTVIKHNTIHTEIDDSRGPFKQKKVQYETWKSDTTWLSKDEDGNLNGKIGGSFVWYISHTFNK